MSLFLPHKPLHNVKFNVDLVLLSVLIWSLLPRDGFVVLNLMEIFSTLRNGASWNIHSLCVQQAAFSISSVKSSWIQQVLQKPTHSCKWGMTQVGILQMGVADLRTRSKTGGFRRWDSSPPGVSQVAISHLGDVIQQGYMWSVQAGFAHSTVACIRQQLFLTQTHGFPIISVKIILFWKNFWSNRFEAF